MITNADMTIFNRRYVKADRTEKFVPTQIRDVSFYTRLGSKDGNGGNIELNKKDTYTVRIPKDAPDKPYVDYLTYSGLSDELAGGFWTIQIGSVVVRGLAEGEFASETELYRAYPEAFPVSNFTDNTDRPTASLRHWRIGGE